MKRHPALEPFSRDHNVGLTIARALAHGQPESAEEFVRLWDQELCDHFDQEESLLGGLLDSEKLDRLTSEHREIRMLKDALPPSGPRLGEALTAHIRWEERELFPWIEATATPEQLERLASATDLVEEKRWEHSSQRKRLVQRRRTR